MGVLMATFAACSNDDDPMGIDDNPSAEFTFDYFEGLIHNNYCSKTRYIRMGIRNGSLFNYNAQRRKLIFSQCCC